MIQTSFFPQPEKDEPIKIIQIAPSGLQPKKLEELVLYRGNIPPDTYMIYPNGGYHPFYKVPNTPPRYQLPIWPCVKRIKYNERWSTEGLLGAKKRNLRKHHTTEHINPFLSTDGYVFISLQDVESISRPQRMHRLVALAFIPNPEKHERVLHKNNDPTNYLSENLVWGTQKDNMRGTANRRPDTPEQKYQDCVNKGFIKG